MKIFDWIHRKFRNNDGQCLHDSNMEGQRVWEEEHEKCRGAGESAWRSPRSSNRISITCHHGEGDGDGDNTNINELLTIGTLGLYQPHQLQHGSLEVDRAESESESDVVTAFEVEIFHGQLEKAFGLKAQNNHNDQAKVESDSVCSERFSNANSNVYPLHEFFNSPSSVAVVEPSQRGPKEKRTSLGDLFSKPDSTATRIESKNDQSHKTSKDSAPQKPSSSLASVKKALKRKSKSNSTQVVESGCRLDKVIGFFHKKIFPEETTQENHTAYSKAPVGTNINKHNKCLGGLGLTNCILPRTQARKVPHDAHVHSHKPPVLIDLPDNPQPPLSAQGQWIKTDDEYVVLEL